MIKIIGTCGHKVPIDTDTTAFSDYDKDGSRIVSGEFVCEKCKERKKEYILKTKEEQDHWLKFGDGLDDEPDL